MTPIYCRCGHTESWHSKKYPTRCEFHCGEAKGMPDSACRCEAFEPLTGREDQQ